MRLLNRRRLAEWYRAVKTSTESKFSLLVKFLLHMPKLKVKGPAWRKRIRTCMGCPIYHPGNKTCGHDPEINKIGCGCYMPFKALATDATCWARDNNLTLQGKTIGWGDDINDMTASDTCHSAKPIYRRGTDD
jgi:hypothetical protein